MHGFCILCSSLTDNRKTSKEFSPCCCPSIPPTRITWSSAKALFLDPSNKVWMVNTSVRYHASLFSRPKFVLGFCSPTVHQPTRYHSAVAEFSCIPQSTAGPGFPWQTQRSYLRRSLQDNSRKAGDVVRLARPILYCQWRPGDHEITSWVYSTFRTRCEARC